MRTASSNPSQLLQRQVEEGEGEGEECRVEHAGSAGPGGRVGGRVRAVPGRRRRDMKSECGRAEETTTSTGHDVDVFVSSRSVTEEDRRRGGVGRFV